MHDPHPTNASAGLQSPTATQTTVVHLDLADGRTAAVVGYRPASTTGLRLDTRALRDACARTTDVVLLAPDHHDLPVLLHAALRCGADTPVLATAAPVTDAVKRVDGRTLVATVDRAALRWVVGPAVLHGPALQQLLARWTAPTVRPLLDVDAQIAWL